MSLVHDGLVGLISKRFVCTYFNTFKGQGYNADAAAALKGISNPQYGVILTPDGKKVRSFGFDFPGVYKAFVLSLKAHPKYNWRSPEEKKILRDASKSPGNAESQFAAARLETSLLQLKAAQKRLQNFIAISSDASQIAEARYLLGHAKLQKLKPRSETVRSDLASISDLSVDLQDDLACDIISSFVQLKAGYGFFLGWEFVKGSDLDGIKVQLQNWIERAPSSNRLGQMYFYLGLVEMTLGNRNEANKIWQKHFETLPEDRFAMLSRIHHTSYVFSPYKNNVGRIDVKRRKKPRKKRKSRDL